MQKPGTLLDFMGAEHTNELVSTFKYAGHLNVLQAIDGFWRAPVEHIDVPQGLHAVPQLYLFVHYHLYSTISNLMRLHVGEALGCLRKAIDASLSAYEMILNPTSAPEYEAGAFKFKFIKRTIEKARKNDATKYPLAPVLLSAWDVCSEFGVHADAKSFGLRLKKVKMEGVNDKHQLFFLYFETPRTEAEGHFLFTDTFVNFLAMARIFGPFLRQYAQGLNHAAWEQQLEALQAACMHNWQQLIDAIEAEDQQAQQQQ